MDWVIYQKYLQSLLKEFDLFVISNERIMIWYFCNELKPSIQTQLDKQDWHIDD